MRRLTFLSAAILFASLVAMPWGAQAQQRYTYSVTRTHDVPIDWQPEENNYQRYTVSVSPLRLASNGLKFDFERELPRAGHWLGTSLALYLAPQRRVSSSPYWSGDGNDRSWFSSGWDDYHRMWGIGTSFVYKNTFSHRGWYYSAGVVLEFYRVGVTANTYTPYVEDGLTFYDYGRELQTKSYFKPTAQILFGKHAAISERVYFDMYVGVGLTYALYKEDNRHLDSSTGSFYIGGEVQRRQYTWPLFTRWDGFAYRGLSPVAGFRIGMLLWKPRP
jgi:hypothetical protein